MLRILLVEDDEDVRVMMQWMLIPKPDFEVEVTGVATADAALDLLEQETQTFDVALVDLMLTGSSMGGHVLAEVLKRGGIETVIIVTAAPYALSRLNVPEDIPVLKKPFNAEDLREMLDV